MVPDIERGYLETEDDAYLEGPYLGGEYEDVFGMQVNMITAAQKVVGQQAQMVINDDKTIGQQALMTVTNTKPIGQQVFMNTAATKINGMQAKMVINDDVSTGMQVKADTLRHALHNVYLEFPYLEEPYLVEQMCTFMGMQVLMQNANTLYPIGQQAQMVINDDKTIGQQAQMIVNAQKNIGQQAKMIVNATKLMGMQTQMIINAQKNMGMQTQMIVNATKLMGMQVDQIRVFRNGMQATMVIYNTTQLRLMCEFPSRGTAALGGNNWTASSQYPGDYSPNNVNTDIVEQIYRSAAATAALTTLVCDTGIPQGVPLDTIAILGHNLTRSATVQVQGSNDNFATINITFNMVVELDNMYYISPTFPTAAGQNRYWKFIFQDSTNPDTYVEAGVIAFGVSDIFSVAECFENPILRGYRHFKDEIANEGFTAVSNDRALKKYLKLRFNKINFFLGNFRMLDEMMNFARTSLKCLVIPTPEYPSRFAVFAKLVQMPEITHTDIDATTGYIDLDMEWDESK